MATESYIVSAQAVSDALFAESSKIKIDLTRIYCQLTGAPIGYLSPDSFCDIAAMGLFDLDDSSDRQEFVDQCFQRVMASARPSPVWNFITPQSLESLRKLRPLETMCYLWNKLTAPIDPNHLKNPRWKYVDIIQHRVIAFDSFLMLQRAGLLTPERLDRMIESLLRIDVFSNLATVSWQGKNPLTLDATEESLDAWIETLYRFSLKERDAGLARMDAGHTSPRNTGNAATRKAYVSLFFENRKPVGESPEAPKPRKAADPAKLKRRAQMQNRVADMLRDLAGEARSYSVPKGAPTPKPVAAITAPKTATLSFAAKLALAKANAAKKES